MMIRGFFTTFLMKQSLGRFGFGNAAFGSGLLVILFMVVNLDFPNKNTNYSALFQPFTKRGRVIEIDARPLQTLAVIDLLRFVERRV